MRKRVELSLIELQRRESSGERTAGYVVDLAAAAVLHHGDLLVFDGASEAYLSVLKKYRPKSRGLGDTIARLTSAVGIEPCGGCKGRQEMLNRLVPYKAS